MWFFVDRGNLRCAFVALLRESKQGASDVAHNNDIVHLVVDDDALNQKMVRWWPILYRKYPNKIVALDADVEHVEDAVVGVGASYHSAEVAVVEKLRSGWRPRGRRVDLDLFSELPQQRVCTDLVMTPVHRQGSR